MTGLPHPGLPTAAAMTASADSARYDTVIRRRQTRSVRVGDLWIGSEHPVVVQSMINEDTLDIEGATAGIRRLHEAGCEIVRVTVPSLAHAKAMGEIRQRLEDTYKPVPLVAEHGAGAWWGTARLETSGVRRIAEAVISVEFKVRTRSCFILATSLRPASVILVRPK